MFYTVLKNLLLWRETHHRFRFIFVRIDEESCSIFVRVQLRKNRWATPLAGGQYYLMKTDAKHDLLSSDVAHSMQKRISHFQKFITQEPRGINS